MAWIVPARNDGRFVWFASIFSAVQVLPPDPGASDSGRKHRALLWLLLVDSLGTQAAALAGTGGVPEKGTAGENTKANTAVCHKAVGGVEAAAGAVLIVQIISIALFIIPALVMMKRDFQKGFCFALGLFASMPSTLHIEGGGGFELTFQRILLLVVIACWAPWVMSRREPVQIPFKRIIVAWWISNLLSLIFAVDSHLSLKWFLSFSTEIVVFYIIVSTTLTNRETLMRAFHALCISSAILAVLGVIEYYKGFNPALEWMGIEEEREPTDVIVTFRHRILFGYCMAMGWPLLLAQAHRVKGRARQITMTIIVMLTIGSCYFSGSRGPWFGAAFAGGIMYVLGDGHVRKSMRIFAFLSVFVIIARPGVRDTLKDLCMSTFDPDSYRGRSYAYRKELWPVAKDLAKTDLTRGLFGHGGLSTETMDLSDRFEYGGSTFHTGFSSWDQNYACDLVEFGWVGLGIECLLYGCVLWTFYRSLGLSFYGKPGICPPEYRNIMAGITASAAVYVLALTNVYMFSPQLKCTFLALIVLGTRIPVYAAEEIENQVESVPEEPIDGGQLIAPKSA
jgi:hypothetical protein